MNYEERIKKSRNYGSKFKGVLFRISAARSLTPVQNLCLVSIVDEIRERQDGVLLAISKISETYSIDEEDVRQGIISLIECGYISQFKFREDSGHWATRYKVNTYAKTFYEQALESEEQAKEEAQRLTLAEEAKEIQLRRAVARKTKRDRFFKGESDEPRHIFELMVDIVDFLAKHKDAKWQGKREDLLIEMELTPNMGSVKNDFAKALKALKQMLVVRTEKAVENEKKQSYLSYELINGDIKDGF